MSGTDSDAVYLVLLDGVSRSASVLGVFAERADAETVYESALEQVSEDEFLTVQRHPLGELGEGEVVEHHSPDDVALDGTLSASNEQEPSR